MKSHFLLLLITPKPPGINMINIVNPIKLMTIPTNSTNQKNSTSKEAPGSTSPAPEIKNLYKRNPTPMQNKKTHTNTLTPADSVRPTIPKETKLQPKETCLKIEFLAKETPLMTSQSRNSKPKPTSTTLTKKDKMTNSKEKSHPKTKGRARKVKAQLCLQKTPSQPR